MNTNMNTNMHMCLTTGIGLFFQRAAMASRSSLRVAGVGGLLALTLLGCNLARIEATVPSVPTPAIDLPVFVPTVTPLPGAPALPNADTPLENGCPPPPPGWVAYAIQNGDSLGSLGAAVGLSIEELATANCITDADTVFAGETIYLPIYPSGYNPNPTSNGPNVGGSG